MSEEKRKALLEEREQLVRERTATAQEQLTTSQVQKAAVEMAMENFNLGEKKRGATRQQTSITQGGAPLRANILGNDINLPGDIQSLTENEALLRQLSEEKLKRDKPEYFTNYPPAGTAAAQIKNSPEARGRDYISEILSGNPPAMLGESGEEYTIRTRAMMKNKLDFLMEQDPDALDALFGKVKSDTTKTKTDSGKNRFKVKVK
jgi:hypothetical protein